MSALSDLINQIDDEELKKRITNEINKLTEQKKFGLVFEEHLPECTPLYEVPIKKGVKVALKTDKVNNYYIVVKKENDKVFCCKQGKTEILEFNEKDLVTVAEFGDPIYPYLKPIDSVCNAPDSDLWHILIEADNYHALQLLEYIYAEKVDCIYIDPPYNTGAKDWKYNNDYVDSNDAYRHSKWLSMMQKRLKLAKKLLNPKDSVLIVTIDEKEYLHLGCLLEQLFPNANIQMVSSVINRHGSMRFSEFTRVNEYIFYVRIGNACIGKMQNKNEEVPIHWHSLRRSGTSKGNFRFGRPKLFYPIYISKNKNKVIKIGEPLGLEEDINKIKSNDDTVVVFPIRTDGREGCWALEPKKARELLSKGYFRVGKYNPNKLQKYDLTYLQSGTVADIENGEIIVKGYDEDDSIIGYYPIGKTTMENNQWDYITHDASEYGTKLLASFVGNRFSYPKSLYAVKDTLKYFVADKKNALILDFFAGSGTTLHAVNLLNALDGGKRKCIMVTNNEVSEVEAKILEQKGFQPGDYEWEKLGIANFVTWPRTVNSITGNNFVGDPIEGKYVDCNIAYADGFKTNAAFLKLGFLDKNAVALGQQLKEIIPLLWLKAGGIGKCPILLNEQNMYIFEENKFAILVDEKFYSDFRNKIYENNNIKTVFIITDSESGFISMSNELKVEKTYQLYRDYLDNFRINIGRD